MSINHNSEINTSNNNNILQPTMKFKQRLDFYWQSSIIYAVILLVYTSIRGLMSGNFQTFIKNDAFILLFLILITISIINLFFTKFKSNSITIGEDFIIIKNRFREKKYLLSDIYDIRFYKEKIFKTHEVLGYFKIKVKQRKRTIRLRATSYWDDELLHKKLVLLKSKLPKKVS